MIDAIFGEDVVLDLLHRPFVWWTTQVTNHNIPIPLDTTGRVLVFVPQTNSVPELVRRRPSIQKA
jgi:hypothetical protein